MVGAPEETTADLETSGAVYVFGMNDQQMRIRVSDPDVTQFGTGFGESVALDDSNLLIGAPDDSSLNFIGRAIHRFDATTGQPLFKFVADPSRSLGSSIGLNVSFGVATNETTAGELASKHATDASCSVGAKSS